MHLWYRNRFGYEIQPYRSVEDAIATFPTVVGSIGVRPGPDGLQIHAPFGLEDLARLIVRPNRTQVTRAIYEDKANRWRALWPALDIWPW